MDQDRRDRSRVAQKPGRGVTSATSSTPVSAGLEGQYQIDPQTLELLGDRQFTGNVWRGVIDTTTLRVTLTSRPTGAQYTDNNGTIRYQRRYACSAEDQQLSETSFVCSNNPVSSPAAPSRKIRRYVLCSRQGTRVLLPFLIR